MEKSVKKLKYNYHRLSKEFIDYPIFTQPSMAFTPRQIIEQFASGEVIAQENHETDDFYDVKFSEQQLFSLNTITDEFQLRQFILDFYENQQYEEKNVNSGKSPEGSVKETSNNVEQSMQSSECGEQN